MEFYQNIKRKLNNNNCVMIGDNLEFDILNPLKHGIDAILYDPDNRYPEFNGKKIRNLIELIKY